MALMLALPRAAAALDFSYEAGAGVRHHDNIGLSDDDPLDPTDDPIEEDVFFGSLRFAALHDAPKLELRARGSVRYLNYLGDTFEDEIRGDIAAQLDWTLMPDRLHWVVEDYLSQQPISTLASPSPENRQQVNVFVTGPTLLVRLGNATVAQLDARYTNSYAEETDAFNGDRLVLKGGLEREISPTTVGSFNIEGARAEFDNSALAIDYTRWDAYFSFEHRLPSLVVTADLGYTQIEPAGAADKSSSPLLRSVIDWRPSSRTSVTARIDYQFADAAQYIIRRSSELASFDDDSVLLTSGDLLDAYQGLGTAGLQVDADAYRERRIDVGYRYNGDRLTMRLHPYVQRVRYESDLSPQLIRQDRNSKGEGFSLDYRLRPALLLSFRGSYESIKYQNLGRTDRISGLSLALSDRSARRWRWRVEVAHVDRESTEVGRSYTDNSISLALTHYRR